MADFYDAFDKEKLKDLTNKIVKGGDKVAKKSQEVIAKGKEKIEIMRLEALISDKKKILGQYFYNTYLSGEGMDGDQLFGICEEIKTLEKSLNKLKQTKENTKYCDLCGKELEVGTKFCSECGKRVIHIEPYTYTGEIYDQKSVTVKIEPPPPPEIEDDEKFCIECGNLLRSDEEFCMFCGTVQPE